MAFAGRIALVLALAVTLYGIAAALYGARRGRRDWVDSARRSVYCLAAVLTVAMAILEVAFIRNDFAYNTVANTSSTTTPLLYRAAAMWSSQEGSLLLWVWLLSIWSSAAMGRLRSPRRAAKWRGAANSFWLARATWSILPAIVAACSRDPLSSASFHRWARIYCQSSSRLCSHAIRI